MCKIFLFLFLSILWIPVSYGQHQNFVIVTLREPNEPSIIINQKNPDLIMVGANQERVLALIAARRRIRNGPC